ncbi:hypothetical protein DL89DRAFT_323040, partial [Linderina pennispora]
ARCTCAHTLCLSRLRTIWRRISASAHWRVTIQLLCFISCTSISFRCLGFDTRISSLPKPTFLWGFLAELWGTFCTSGSGPRTCSGRWSTCSGGGSACPSTRNKATNRLASSGQGLRIEQRPEQNKVALFAALFLC